MNLHTWAQKWGVSLECLRDLQTTLGLYTPPMSVGVSGLDRKSEAWAQSAVRIEASLKGCYLFRNNVGALKDKTGRLVRYGLGNDSQALNDVLKSSDLIGWRQVLITPHLVGRTVAQFVAREVKEPGHQVTPDTDEHERAQLAFLNLVNANGGDGAFCTGPGTL